MRSKTVSIACGIIIFAASNVLREVGAHGQRRRLQQSSLSSCGADTSELIVVAGESSGPDDVTAALLEAGVCATTAANSSSVVITVHWNSSGVQTSEPFLVPRGVELRVIGNGWYNQSSDSSAQDLDLDDELETAIASTAAAAGWEDSEPSVISSSGGGGGGLFVVQAGGALHLSDVVLSGAWGGEDGGRAVSLVGGEVTGTDVRWESLSAEGAGGAIYAQDGGTVTLKGLHHFHNCSSGTLGGGAVFLQDAYGLFGDGAQVYFEGCGAPDSSGGDGGGVELSASNLTISSNGRTRFRECSAGDKGGGLYMKDSVVDVGDSASLEFQACASGSSSGNKGGGVCAYDSAMSIGAGTTVTFLENSSPIEDGGGMFAESMTLSVDGDGASLVFTDNFSGDSGGGLTLEMGSDEDEIGICLSLAEGATMDFSGNAATQYGGGMYVVGCKASVAGSVSFRGNHGERAGGLYIDEGGVSISGNASFVGNTADRWGGAVYVVDSREDDGLGLRMTGGVDFTGNAAGRSGGGIYVVNGDVAVVRDATTAAGEDELPGASWDGNTAGYDGGVIAVDGGGVWLEGGLASSNSASERGGVLFGIGESNVSWSGGGASWNNSAASGGTIYVSSSVANLTDLRLAGDHTPSGANLFFAGADARAVNVTAVAPEELEATFALHVDSGSAFRAFACVFEGWDGDSPSVVSEGDMVLDVCDFSGSGTPTLVRASRAVAIRNAVLGDQNFGRAGFNASSLLGVGAHGCSSLPEGLSCSVAEECVDAENGMGVLCPSFTEAATGGLFSLADVKDEDDRVGFSTVELVSSSSAGSTSSSSASASSSSSSSFATAEVYYPDLVTHELVLRYSSSEEEEAAAAAAAAAGSQLGVLWRLQRTDGDGGAQAADDETGAFEGAAPDNFTWTAVPWSGYLVRGQEVTIQLVGTPPPPPDPSAAFAVYNGEVAAEFRVVTRTAAADSAAASVAAGVERTFYYCAAGLYWDGEACVTCAQAMATMADGEDSLECSVPGITLDTLPLAEG
ncbi:unnamed protein product, partial [Ectocarpus sp. 12 AP-2014]